MFTDNETMTVAQRELELQRMKWRHEDNIRLATVEMMFKRLEPDGFGGVNIKELPIAKDYRNTLRRIATLENLLRQYR